MGAFDGELRTSMRVRRIQVCHSRLEEIQTCALRLWTRWALVASNAVGRGVSASEQQTQVYRPRKPGYARDHSMRNSAGSRDSSSAPGLTHAESPSACSRSWTRSG